MESKGRWPANVILDEETALLLDEQSGKVYSEKRTKIIARHGKGKGKGIFGDYGCALYDTPSYPDSGGASRFFYCAKANRTEREAGLDGLKYANFQSGCAGNMSTDDRGRDRDRFKVMTRNYHPTVKPISLMRWLVRLVTPPGGLIVDPFVGSGTTIIAADIEGFRCIGIEKEIEYVEIANARIAYWKKQSNKQLKLSII